MGPRPLFLCLLVLPTGLACNLGSRATASPVVHVPQGDAPLQAPSGPPAPSSPAPLSPSPPRPAHTAVPVGPVVRDVATRIPAPVRSGRAARVDASSHKPAYERPVTDGRIFAKAIQRVVRAAMPRFRACYEKHLRPCPNLSSGVRASFAIASDGSVSDTTVTSDSVRTAVTRCVETVMSSLSFPPRDGEGSIKVSYPLHFTPGS